MTLAGYSRLTSESATTGVAHSAHGTAFLQRATCAMWDRAGDARRAVIVGSLATAATAPDPESRGATLGSSSAFLLLDRVCSTHASQTALLYSIYNRGASFQALRAGFG
jgi:hypothetical protein